MTCAAFSADSRHWLILLVMALCWVGLSGAARAQLSPGPLSEPHAGLEGNSSCLECHSSDKGVDPDLCLSCHGLLRDRIEAGRGLHARADYADCKSCHIDHYGREFELVWWGEQGVETFDHELTGLALEGAHRRLGCRECHRAELNPEVASLRSAGKDPARSFLGLSGACLSCHLDEHRGQFVAGSCVGCHTQVGWSPARGFEHSEARYPLTGLHLQVDCGECHPVVEPAEGSDDGFTRFVGLAYSQCIACHQDPHDRRLGADCAGCHATAGWEQVDDSAFDHDLTSYALRGRHRSVGCEGCHRDGVEKRGLAFGACADCHGDEHAGQFDGRVDGRADGGRCESCHTVEGFVPATFGLEEHERIFALEDSHRSVECVACHADVPADDLVRSGLVSPAAIGGRIELTRFRFESTECAACHEDPHAGTATAMSAPVGCETCHTVRAWSEVGFDHLATGFELSGGHSGVACGACHVETAAAARGADFSGLAVECASCHEDHHLGQFERQDSTVDCQSCHRVESWIPAPGFDHSRDASFALDGAHARVACENCHRSESSGAREFVRYRPLPGRCSDCHAGSS